MHRLKIVYCCAKAKCGSHENLLVGFQQHLQADTDALLTFFYPTRQQVDAMYPRIEFQCFLHQLPAWQFSG